MCNLIFNINTSEYRREVFLLSSYQLVKVQTYMNDV